LCVAAEDGFFTRGPGSTRQIPCGANTVSNQDHTDCVTDCTFTDPSFGISLILSFSFLCGEEAKQKQNNSTKGIKIFQYDLNALYNPEVMNFAGSDP